MSRGATRVELTFAADLAGLRKEMAQLPGVTEKEAKAAVRSIERQYKRMEKQAKASARRNAKAWSDGFRTLQVTAVAAATAAAAAVWTLTQRVADLRNELTDMETRTGVGADALAGLRLAAEGSGAQLGDMEAGLRKLGQQMKAANDGNARAQKSFRDLGVEWEDGQGNLREIEDVMRDTWSALRDGRSETDAVTRGNELLGRSYGTLAQALGDVPLDTYIRQARIAGQTVTPEAAEAAGQWQRAVASLKAVFEGTLAQLSDFIALGDQVEAFTLGFVWMKEMIVQSVQDIVPWVTQLGELLLGVATLDTSRTTRALSLMDDIVRQNVKAATDLSQEFWQTNREIKAGGGASKELAAALRDQADAGEGAAGGAREHASAMREAEAAARAYERAVSDQLQAIGRLQTLARESADDLLSEEERILRAYQERLDLIDDLEVEGQSFANAEAARSAAEARMRRDLQRINRERVDAEIRGWQETTEAAAESLGELEQIAAQIGEALEQASREMMETTVRDVDGIVSAMGDLAQVAQAYHEDQVERIRDESNERHAAFRQSRQEERARIHDLLERGKIDEAQHAQMLADLKEANKAKRQAHFRQRRDEYQAMLRGWRAQKRAQVGQAVIDAARAALALIPAHAYLGPFATAAAAASAAAALGLQLRTIHKQEPPAFSGGGAVWERFVGRSPSPDHQIISSRLDEGIVSPRGMATLGSQGLDAINRGEGVGVGGDIILRVDGRDVARAPRRSGETLRPLAGRIAGRAPVYGRG